MCVCMLLGPDIEAARAGVCIGCMGWLMDCERCWYESTGLYVDINGWVEGAYCWVGGGMDGLR